MIRSTPLRSSSTTEITETMAMASLLRTKALIPSVEPSRMTTLSCGMRMPARPSAALMTSSVPDPPSRNTSGISRSSSAVIDSVRE